MRPLNLTEAALLFVQLPLPRDPGLTGTGKLGPPVTRCPFTTVRTVRDPRLGLADGTHRQRPGFSMLGSDGRDPAPGAWKWLPTWADARRPDG